MSDSTIRLIAAIALIFHGVGHYMGIMAGLGIKLTAGMSAESPLLTGILGTRGIRIICLILFTLALIGFIASGFSLLGWMVPQSWWLKLAVVSAVISMLGLVFYWNALAFFFNKFGAVIINSAVFICLLFLRWPQAIFRRYGLSQRIPTVLSIRLNFLFNEERRIR